MSKIVFYYNLERKLKERTFSSCSIEKDANPAKRIQDMKNLDN